ncbi:MAG: hypothetical protein GX591_16600 [Planctomycetes bacterium]|nr:hypothetical protein [Planctomycetota bacterium]
MTTILFPSPDTGPMISPPRLRVLWRPVAARGDGAPAWGEQTACPTIAPGRLRWGADGAMTTLTLECRLGRGPRRSKSYGADREDVWPSAGDRIDLVDDADAAAGWFAGHVGQESILIQSGGDAERRDLVAYGPELRLRGRAVHGQWCKTPEADDWQRDGVLTAARAVRENTFLADLPAVFNLGGRPNASTGTAWTLSESPCLSEPCGRVFEPAGRCIRGAGGDEAIAAAHWTVAAALRSLVEYVDNYEVISPRTDWAAIEAVLGGAVLGEVAVEGLSLLEAMGRLLGPAGFGFCLEPWSDGQTYADGASRHVLRVFARHGRRPLGRPPVLGGGGADTASAAGRAAAVQRLEFLRDSHNVCNDVQVIGALRRVQVCLTFDPRGGASDLHPAWDTAAHDLAAWAVGGVIPEMDVLANAVGATVDAAAFLRRYSRAGAENLAYFDVFRTFVWNEDGAYRPLVAAEPDLSGLLGTAAYVRRPRPLGPTLLRAAAGTGSGVLPAYVELGVAGDDDAWILLPEARVLPDRAGFTLNAARLDACYPYAGADPVLRARYGGRLGKFSLATLLYNALRTDGGGGDRAARFRLVGTIESDAAVVGRSGYRLESTWPFKATRIDYRGDRFAAAAVAEGGNPSGREAITLDDTADADACAGRIREAAGDAMGHGSIMLRTLTRSVRPGMAWTRTAGRQVSLAVGAGASRAAEVVGVVWNFAEGAGKTELILDSPLLEVNP